MKIVYLMIALTLCSLNSYARKIHFQEAWEEISSPQIMSTFFIHDFSELPQQGNTEAFGRYWSGHYWPLNKGSINYRWYARNKIGFNLSSPGFNEAKKMSIPELAELSPAEKYDLFVGNYHYPLTQEVSKLANPKAQPWEGMCHGWSPASMNHIEPRSKLMPNPDGIEVPFGSTDIKALLSYYYAYKFQAPDTHQIGKRCYKGPFLNDEKDCWNDLNAGAFHIILANRIGLDKKGFIADLNRFKEIWNHPVTRYESMILEEFPPDQFSASGTIRQLKLKTRIKYLDESGLDWHPVIGTSKQVYKEKIYLYDVELDARGRIIGGDWLSKDRPDFLWLMYRPRSFEGVFKRLGELLDDP